MSLHSVMWQRSKCQFHQQARATISTAKPSMSPRSAAVFPTLPAADVLDSDDIERRFLVRLLLSHVGLA
jgi:hypothetical protein